MAYFTSFLVCHLYSRHRFSSCGFPVLDYFFRIVVYAALFAWAGMVAYSRYVIYFSTQRKTKHLDRYYLGYHNTHQILWGLGIGALLGTTLYIVAEAVPSRYPSSPLGRVKTALLNNPVIVWLQIRDGWAVWADGGREVEWNRWREEWKRQQKIATTKTKTR